MTDTKKPNYERRPMSASMLDSFYNGNIPDAVLRQWQKDGLEPASYDTTDQQAVTVAQEDREAAHAIRFQQLGYTVKMGDEHSLVQAFARHRLASVSSASAEGFVLVPRVPTEAMVASVIRTVGNETYVGSIWSAMLAASPEPVPATNQAGEVGIEAHAKRVDDEIYCWWECPGEEIQPLIMGLDVAREFYADLTAALATQPATSQEGELVSQLARLAHTGDDGWTPPGDDDDSSEILDSLIAKARDITAATPTPPTLSEDLREAVWRAFVLVDHFAGEGLIYHCEDGSQLAADEVAREICAAVGIELEDGWPLTAAALAQVKAS